MLQYPTPIYRILQDGNDITSRLRPRLESLTLTDNRGEEADQLEINLDDSDGLLEIPMRGVELAVAFGWRETGLVEKGTFVVDEIEHTGAPDRLTIRARSADLRGNLTQQKERSWHGLTIGDIVRKIAKEHSLKAVIAAPLALKSIAHIDQTNESDISFLSRIARMFDAIANVKAGNLIFMATGAAATASSIALGKVTITRQDGDSHRFTVADRDGATAVKALYQDTRTGKQGEVIIDESNLAQQPAAEETPITEVTPAGRVLTLPTIYASKSVATRKAREKLRELKRGNKIYTEVVAMYKDPENSGIAEVTITEKNLNKPEKKESRDTYAPPTLQASADNVRTLRHVYANRTNAIRAAQSEYRRMVRGMATFSINLAMGQAELIPELPVSVSGWKESIDSTDWVAARVVHSMSNSGLTTSVDLELKIMN